jgi:hypothetical protein
LKSTFQYLFSLLLCLAGIYAYSQPQENLVQSIRGKVIDADSKQALPGAVIELLQATGNLATSADENGNFKLSGVPIGRQVIRAKFIGYHERTLSNIVVTSGKEVVLEIELTEKVTETGVVEIVAGTEKGRPNNELALVSARSFQVEEANRYAGSRGDVSRMVTNYAGVASGNDARNDIIVRGNSPLGVLWRLEGADIPNPNHFSAQGATGGPISILNNNLLAASDFMTGAFPAEYGGRLAAAFDLKMRPGNNEKNEYTGQVGINGFELGAEGPFKKGENASYLINYRYSTLQAFDLLGIRFGVSGVPEYQDISFKINIPTAKYGVLSVWGIGGKSDISLLDSEKEDGDWSFSGRGTDLVYGTRMGAAGLNHTFFFSPKTMGRFSYTLSGSRFIATVDTISLTGDKFRTFDNFSDEYQQQFQFLLNHKFNSKNLLRVGGSAYLSGFNYQNTQFSRILKKQIDLFSEKGNTGFHRFFVQWQHRFNDRLTWNSGLHYIGLWLNGSQSIEPRSSLALKLNQGATISAGFGTHSQLHPWVYYFLESTHPTVNNSFQTNRNLDFMKANHYILAYEQLLGKSTRFKTEIYYQQLFKVPVETTPSVYSIINSGRDIGNLDLEDSLVNTGKGRNYGIEFTLEKFFSNHFYYLVSTSLYKSLYTASDQIERQTAFSGNYIITGLAGYEWNFKSRNLSLAVDLRGTRSGGNRYIPTDVAASIISGTSVLDYQNAFKSQFPFYQRIDFKISLRYDGKKTSQSIFISLENIQNRKNILRSYFDPRIGNMVNEYQFGLFPIGGYRIEF